MDNDWIGVLASLGIGFLVCIGLSQSDAAMDRQLQTSCGVVGLTNAAASNMLGILPVSLPRVFLLHPVSSALAHDLMSDLLSVMVSVGKCGSFLRWMRSRSAK